MQNKFRPIQTTSLRCWKMGCVGGRAVLCFNDFEVEEVHISYPFQMQLGRIYRRKKEKGGF